MTFIIKVSGAPTRSTIADYECPYHGRFEATVERDENGDPPPTVECKEDGTLSAGGACLIAGFECGAIAEWRISAPMGRVKRVEAIKGKWTKPERKTYTDTRNVGEGQPLYEWKDDRAAVWEEVRKADVMKFAKEH